MKLGTWIAAGLGACFFAACGGEDLEEQVDADRTEDVFSCASCSGETICIDNRCEAAFPRYYTLQVLNVSFPERKSDGSCWDEPGCGAPDPEVEIKVDGREVATLELDDDTYALDVNRTLDFQLVAGSSLELELEDEDLVDDETALECRFEPITAADLRQGDVSCSGGNVRLEARIYVRGQQLPPS